MEQTTAGTGCTEHGRGAPCHCPHGGVVHRKCVGDVHVKEAAIDELHVCSHGLTRAEVSLSVVLDLLLSMDARRLCSLLVLLAVSVGHAAPSDGELKVMASPEMMREEALGFGGCALCRNSGKCSIAVNNEASGVFCGDLVESKTPCCCQYQTECRVTKSSTTCECWSAEDSVLRARRADRLQAAEAIEDESQIEEMSASTEILIHLSAYLLLFVVAMFIDDWVECCRDFRRSQFVKTAVDKSIVKLKQKYARRRGARGSSSQGATLFSDSEEEDEEAFGQLSEGFDDAPLLLAMSPAARTASAEAAEAAAVHVSVELSPVEDAHMDRVA